MYIKKTDYEKKRRLQNNIIHKQKARNMLEAGNVAMQWKCLMMGYFAFPVQGQGVANL